MPSNWRPYLYQSEVGGIIVTGCKTRPKKSGKDKGGTLFLTKEDKLKVLITSEDIERQKEILRNQ